MKPAKSFAHVFAQLLSWVSLGSDKIESLTPEQAKRLVTEFKGEYLYLNGLTKLDAASAKALAKLKGEGLFLSGLTTLNDDIAKVLAESTAWDGWLPHITALDSPDSVAIAQALAARKGPLALPNLEQISPKTLTALLGKRDIEIPPVETLDLIAEPDGSPTEDFVIQKWLAEQNKGRR